MERVLIQKYEIIRLLGEGGSGKVFLALDVHLDRLVAVKEVCESVSLEEVKLLKELEHTGLPVIYDYFFEQGKAFLVMEYIEGMTLRQFLLKHKKVEKEQAVKWMLELCRIIRYLHDRHPAVIYRDLKPENIMIRQDGVLKLIDLGGAVRFACGRKTPDLCVGTTGYCPKEQWKSPRGDTSWDIYAMGMVFYEMLTGNHPAKPPYAKLPLQTYDKSIPGTLEKIIRCCISEKKTDRYQSVLQLEKALLGYRKMNLPLRCRQAVKKAILFTGVFGTGACLILPLLNGILEDQIPFPYLKKPLFFLLFTLFFYRFCYHSPNKNNYLCKQEKNIWLTRKGFSGLISLLIFGCLGTWMSIIPGITFPAAYARENTGKLWVEMRDDYGRKMLLKEDAVYMTDNCVRFELPAQRLPDEKIALQMVAVGEGGDIYSSRIFYIKAQEDLN